MAGIYSKVVSTTRQIDSIYAFVNGSREQIQTVWTFINGERKQLFPAAEVFTEVFSNTTGGAYTTTLGYGRYKVVMSGGGGSGSSMAVRSTGYMSNRVQEKGFNGEEITRIIDVPDGETWTFSGTVGTGGKASSSYAGSSAHSEASGAAGTGYENGTKGTVAHVHGLGAYYALAGGSAGGSTSLFVDWGTGPTRFEVAKGGNGGSASLDVPVRTGDNTGRTEHLSVAGGVGGSGGTTTGTGATGGAIGYGAGSSSGNSSGAGADGYIYIYQSSIYPN